MNGLRWALCKPPYYAAPHVTPLSALHPPAVTVPPLLCGSEVEPELWEDRECQAAFAVHSWASVCPYP